MEIDISSYVSEKGFIDPKLSKLVRNAELPGFEIRMEGECDFKTTFDVERLVDLYGVPKEMYNMGNHTGVVAAPLNWLNRVSRPNSLRQSSAAGYKIKGDRELVLDPQNLIAIANNQPNSQFGDPKNIPSDLEITLSEIARRQASDKSAVYGSEYIAGEHTSKNEHIYWASIGENGLLYLSGLNLGLRGNNASLSLYLGIPGRKEVDEFVDGLKQKLGSDALKVTDKRYKGRRKNSGSGDDFPLPAVVSAISSF